MGCSASVKRKACPPEARTQKKSAKTVAPTLREQECTPELLTTVKDLGLEVCLPNLRALGVQSLEDVAELLVSDLEEAGLSRVQVRQLQRVVQASDAAAPAGSRGAASQAAARVAAGGVFGVAGTAPAGAFAPARAPATSPQGPRKVAGLEPAAGVCKGDGAAMTPVEEARFAGSEEQDEEPTKSFYWVEKSDRGHPPSGTPEHEALDVLSADSNSGDTPQAAATELRPPGPLARSREKEKSMEKLLASPAPQQESAKTLERSAKSPAPHQEPEKTLNLSEMKPPCHEEQPSDSWDESEIKPPTRKEPLPAAMPPRMPVAPPSKAGAGTAESLDFDFTLLPSAGEASDMERTLVSAPEEEEEPAEEQTLYSSPPTRCPPPASKRPTRSPDIEEQPLLSSPPTRCSPPPASRRPARSPESEPAPEEEPSSQPAAGLRGSDGSSPSRSRREEWRDVVRRQQPDQLQEGPVGSMIPEAVRRRLDRRADQRSMSRGARVQAPQHAPPYQQQIAPPPRSPPPGANAHGGPPQRSASVDAPGAGGGRTPSRPRRSESASAAAEKGGRQMFDKNALRKVHRELFIGGIRRYRQQALRIEPEGAAPGPDLASCTLRPAPSTVRVFVRKRPLFEHEESDRGEYDVATVVPGRPLPTKLILHNCMFQADLKTPYISHLHFEYDHVFREGAQDHEVYRVSASELVRHAREGGAGTMFMFGQTGSGKTHTMTAIEGMAAHDLFEGASGGEPWLSLQFIELRGNRCFDLLIAGKERRAELRLREHGDGSYAAEGATQLQPKGPQELCALLRAAHARRATSATDANSTSSRSHAVCTLRMLRSGGRLTLADCAGTERRKDSMYHSKERQQEGAEINASLHALKECVRYASQRQRVPPHVFRASALTKLLSGAFAHAEGSQLAVICTVSPCAMDAEHTLATLRTGMALAGRGAEREEKEVLVMEQQQREVHPKQWTPEQVSVWLGKVNGGKFVDVRDSLPSNFTGQMLVRLTEGRCAQLCGDDNRRGRLLFDLLHQEIKRADLARRPPQASP